MPCGRVGAECRVWLNMDRLVGVSGGGERGWRTADGNFIVGEDVVEGGQGVGEGRGVEIGSRAKREGGLVGWPRKWGLGALGEGWQT